jgi:hypothetical protein
MTRRPYRRLALVLTLVGIAAIAIGFALTELLRRSAKHAPPVAAHPAIASPAPYASAPVALKPSAHPVVPAMIVDPRIRTTTEPAQQQTASGAAAANEGSGARREAISEPVRPAIPIEAEPITAGEQAQGASPGP